MSILKTPLLSAINSYCQQLEKEFSLIPPERKKYLFALSNYFSKKIKQQKIPSAIIICTHNSRRSHLGQIWLAVGADYYQLPKIATYSGGTEATAFNPRVVAALQKVGFQIAQTRFESATNPIYEISWTGNGASHETFSKKFDSPPNPTTSFAAIMVCTEADKGCPLVAGADFRLALPYEDPKAFDDSPLEKEKYLERSRQIGREMLYSMSQVSVE